MARIQKRLHVALDDAAVRAGRTDKGEIRAGVFGQRPGARRDLQIAGNDSRLGQFLCRSRGFGRGGLRGGFFLLFLRGGRGAVGIELRRALARDVYKRQKVRMVISLPLRLTSALPKGIS